MNATGKGAAIAGAASAPGKPRDSLSHAEAAGVGKAAGRSGSLTDAVRRPRRHARGMRVESAIGRDELEGLVAEYRRVREEHRRTETGSRVRRHLDVRLAEIAERFERLLEEAVRDGPEQERWRAHLYAGTPEPAEPTVPRPLRFRGRSGAGSVLEIRDRVDGALDVLVDGAPVERLDTADELLPTRPGLTFHLAGTAYDETFAAPGEALDALAGMVGSGGPAPHSFAQALLLDGLIDRNFGLTARGRRALGLERPGSPAGAPELAVSSHGRVPAWARAEVEEKLAKLARFAPRPVLFGRARLTHEEDPALERPETITASMDASGQIVRAHVAAASMADAIDLLEQRLRRVLGELSEREEAGRHESGVPQPGTWRHADLPAPRPVYFARPPEERELVRRKTFALAPMSVEEAAWEMKMLDHDFHLFTNAATAEENLVYAGRDDVLHLAQMTPPAETSVGFALVDPAPAPRLTLDQAIGALDVSGKPFLFFVDSDRGRGAVAYRRYDGHYGLVSATD